LACVIVAWILCFRSDGPRKSVKKRASPEECQRRRQQERYERSQIKLDYDPSSNETLNHFDGVKSKSKCLFAKQSRLWATEGYRSDKTLEQNMMKSLPAIIKFVTLADSNDSKLDGFVIEIRGSQYCGDVTSFARTVRQVLRVISDHDPVGVHCMDMESIDRPGWHFTFCTVPIFITSFAPFYGPRHSRHMYPDASTAQSCFILLQPETSFHRHDIGSDTPLTQFVNPVTMRDKIRCSFFNANQKYHIHPTNRYPVSSTFVACPELTETEGEGSLIRTLSPGIVSFWDKQRYPTIDNQAESIESRPVSAL
jgi:FPC/CPF motif-containing protein YcgG